MKTKSFWLMLFYFLTVGLYIYFSHQPTNFHFMSPWENLVPIVPILVIPYLFATVMFLAFPLFLLFNAESNVFYKYLATQSIASILSYVIFVIFPTSVARQPINNPGIFGDALKILHTVDRPSAAFPSGHVFGSLIIGYFLWIYYPKTRIYIIIILPLIVISTVSLRQHYLPDIPGGILVAIIATLLVNQRTVAKLLSSS